MNRLVRVTVVAYGAVAERMAALYIRPHRIRIRGAHRIRVTRQQERDRNQARYLLAAVVGAKAPTEAEAQRIAKLVLDATRRPGSKFL
jgi:hypothetical protein